jgi:hypothetical protein
MARQVDTELPHFPIRGAGVPSGSHTISTTTWMPYAWSINNVVLAETSHTALAMWEAGRTEAAYPLLKGALLDSMFLGICPGNVGMCTWFDVNRRESQRDFGDGIGTLSRTIVEGVFGVLPDLLAGEVRLRPGFPADWNRAKMQSRFPRAVRLRLQVPARRDDISAVTVNGQPVSWRVLEDSVGTSKVEIETVAATEHNVSIAWRGQTPAPAPAETALHIGAAFRVDAGATIGEFFDPQGALRDARFSAKTLQGTVVGATGHRTAFAREPRSVELVATGDVCSAGGQADASAGVYDRLVKARRGGEARRGSDVVALQRSGCANF